jgi:hypothetical protein
LKAYDEKLDKHKMTIDCTSPKNLLFDKYLINQRQTQSVINDLNDSLTENLILKQTQQTTSSFADIQDRLKDIESSRKSLDENIRALWRNRDNSLLYCLAGTSVVDP